MINRERSKAISVKWFEKEPASRYFEVYERSEIDPLGFWGEAAQEIDWFEKAKSVFDPGEGVYGRWFVGAVCNTCHNAIDRHVLGGRATQPALIYDSPVTGTKKTYTYGELLIEVSTLAAILKDFGVCKGDRVILYMPMVPEALFGMLACARIGAIHSVVFGGFAPNELAARINDAKPKLVLSASCAVEGGRVIAQKSALDEAIKLAQTEPEICIILQRPQVKADLMAGRDYDWGELREVALKAGKRTDCVPVLATDPLYILYTSGTTGKTKGIVRDNGGHMVALKWSMKNFYGINPGEVFWAASDVSWVVGHSYTVYAPLLHGCTTIFYEGKPVGTPDAGAFWRVIAEHKCVALFTGTTAFRAIKKEDPEAKLLYRYDLSKLRAVFLAGERVDSATLKWGEKILKVPVIDHWWQTETGWPIAGNPVGLGLLPVKHGSSGVAMPGYRVRIADETCANLPAKVIGLIVIKLPLPPGNLPTLWEQADRFMKTYLSDFPGYYNTGDLGFRDKDGRIYITGRADDTYRVATLGHQLSTVAIEQVICSHKDIAECAVIAIKDELKGEVPCAFVVLYPRINRSAAEIEKEVVDMVRDKIGPVAAFKVAIVVPGLPKTGSGKLVRRAMKDIANTGSPRTSYAISDPNILDEIAKVVKQRGIRAWHSSDESEGLIAEQLTERGATGVKDECDNVDTEEGS